MDWCTVVGAGVPEYCSLDTAEGSDCFGHWILECAIFLPKIIALRKTYPSLKLVLHCKRRYKLNTLIDFGLTEADVVYSPTFSKSDTVTFRHVVPNSRCYIVPKFRYGKGFRIDDTAFIETIEEFRSALLEPYKTRPKTIPAVYMTRSRLENYDSPNKRVFRNHDEIIYACGQKGVTMCQVDTLSTISQQVEIVQSSRVVIVEYGSATTNGYMFATNSHILILNHYPVGNQTNRFIEDLMTRHGNTFEYMEPIGDWRDFSINVSDFKDRLDTRMPTFGIPRYIEQLSKCEDSIQRTIETLLPLLRDKPVYLTGIGKSGLVARKSVATWQSFGLSAHFLAAQDMLHGDIGVLRPNDVIVYVSNSGNTDELAPICSYIRSHLPTTTQVLLCNNPSPSLSSSMDVVCTIGAGKIIEIDPANFAPTVSSVVFMACLDMIAVRLSDKTTIESMQRNHPGGNLGKLQSGPIHK